MMQVLVSCHEGESAMPRPQKPDRRKEKTEANRALKHRLWDEQAAREARQDALVQSIIDKALAKKKSGEFSLLDAFDEINEAREMALALQQPSSAAKCTWYKAQLAGLLIQQHAHAVAVGQPGDFNLQGNIGDTRRRLLERISERHGSRKAKLMIEYAERIFKASDEELEKLEVDDDVIDGEATDVE
jgi:hypothetical protein